ncbi:MAG: hypothetical protein PF495_04320 [Spirochaetales bacterium]|jgi:hypothetical protein|nr:hypothetical protein [Spirochaetales bacterium]
MKVIIGESPVTFRRKTYAPGDKVDLPNQIARNLIDKGACEIPGKGTEGKEQKPEVRNQKSEIGSQRSEIGSQKTATANRNSLPVKEMKNANNKMSDRG